MSAPLEIRFAEFELERERHEIFQKIRNSLVGKPFTEIAHARTQGDLNENAEYHAAKERQDQIEVNIIEIENKIAHAEIITASASDSNHIIFGATVLVRDLNTDKEMEYTLVGPAGIDIGNNKISSKSPIGKGLMGKKVGDKIEIQTPKGILNLQVLKFY